MNLFASVKGFEEESGGYLRGEKKDELDRG